MSELINYDKTRSAPRIAYASAGSGEESIFFLHGIGGNKTNWSEQLRFFSQHGYRAIAWDLRGYGDSDDYAGEFLFEEISADLVRLMDELRVKKAHFVGLSMGGRILMDFASSHSNRIQSLSICAAFPSFGKALSDEQRHDYIRLRKQPLLSGRSFAELAPDLVSSLLGPTASEAMYNTLYESICQLRKDSYLKALEAAVFFDRSKEIQGIQSPTLLLYGEHDHLTPPEMGLKVKALMPHAQMSVLAACGHLINLEASDAFNQIVYQFIKTGHIDESIN